jgi:hypothetical protein
MLLLAEGYQRRYTERIFPLQRLFMAGAKQNDKSGMMDTIESSIVNALVTWPKRPANSAETAVFAIEFGALATSESIKACMP